MGKIFTISEVNKSFIWLPPKTASSTLSWIFSHFDFGHYTLENEKLKIFREDLIHFGHETNLPPNHEEYLFILSMANPYDRVLSLFKMGNVERKSNLKEEDFDNFLAKNILENKNFVWNVSSLLVDRNPNFIIKKENLFEDLIQVPFIKNSKLHNCGILRDMCNKKINFSFDTELKERFLNDRNKEKIYNFFELDFLYFGYPK